MKVVGTQIHRRRSPGREEAFMLLGHGTAVPVVAIDGEKYRKRGARA